MERYEYTIEGQKIVLTEADELFAQLFDLYHSNIREQVQNYHEALEVFSKTIMTDADELKQCRGRMINMDKSVRLPLAEICNSDIELVLSSYLEQIVGIYTMMPQALSLIFQDNEYNIKYINIYEHIQKFIKEKALRDYYDTYGSEANLDDEYDKELYDELLELVELDDNDNLVSTMYVNDDNSIFRKYYLLNPYEDRDGKVSAVRLMDFFDNCFTEDARLNLADNLYEDSMHCLMHYLGLLSQQCKLGFNEQYCSWENYNQFVRENDAIEEEINRKKTVSRERMIKNLAKFPFDKEQYVRLISEYGLFDNQIIEIAKKVRISSKALEDINDEMGPTNLDKNFENKLLEIIEKDIISIDGYTIIGNDLKKSNQKMATKAQNTLGIHKNDKIFMLSDGTLFKSFKEGFAVCSSGIYARNPSKVIHRKWSELLNTEIERKGTNLIIDGLQVFTYVKKEEGEQLFADIKKLLQENFGEPELQKNATEEKTVAISDIMQDENSVKKESVEIRYCTECGAKVSSSAKFCQQCGNKLENTENVEEIKPQLFRVDLVDVGEEKARVIKIIMDNFKKDVRSAKEMTDSVPILLEENLLKEEADALEMLFRDAGAKVKLTRL